MAEPTPRYARIAGTGGYLPERVLSNAELEGMLDTSDAWIRSRTGIRQRHLAADHQGTCDLAEQASRNALQAAGVEAAEVDLVIVATTTPDQVFPSTACLLQKRLGVRRGPALDVQAVCAGFVYAFDIADKFIRQGSAQTALVVGAEVFSRLLNWEDRSTCVLFGDGAGAVLLRAAAEPGVLRSRLHADGRHFDLLEVPMCPTRPHAPNGADYLRMQGEETFKIAVREMSAVALQLLDECSLEREQVDWLVPHQANIRILQAVAKRLGLPMERVVCTIEHHGNTSAASVPLALDSAVRAQRIRRGEYVLLEAFGGGFAWGANLLKY